MVHSLSNFDSRLSDVSDGLLVFEIWRPPGSLLVNLNKLSPATEHSINLTVTCYVIYKFHIAISMQMACICSFE